jgi:hypothetical protein
VTEDPNEVELDEPVQRQAKWTRFAAQLRDAMAEYPLEGVTILLREFNKAELADDDGGDVLTFNQETQRFEFAIHPARSFPPAWTVADRIDAFLNPDEEAALS